MGDRDIPQADEGLQISVTAEAYLYEERLDVDVPKPAPSSFAGYSTKLNASDNEESSTRPSSRTSSIGSSTNTIGRLKPQYAHQPRPQTRIQERSARDASREESGESGQVSICFVLHGVGRVEVSEETSAWAFVLCSHAKCSPKCSLWCSLFFWD